MYWILFFISSYCCATSFSAASTSAFMVTRAASFSAISFSRILICSFRLPACFSRSFRYFSVADICPLMLPSCCSAFFLSSSAFRFSSFRRSISACVSLLTARTAKAGAPTQRMSTRHMILTRNLLLLSLITYFLSYLQFRIFPHSIFCPEHFPSAGPNYQLYFVSVPHSCIFAKSC